MLFLPAAALCCLCSALVAMAADLTQDQLTWTRRVGQTVSFRCEGTGQCNNNYIFWYQKKETETFKLIIRIDKSNGGINKGYNHPQEDDFSAVYKQISWELEIKKVKVDHSASYYCSCWFYTHRIFIFGSGTKLYVTDERVVKPVVSVYPAASRPNQEGKSSLLCLASSMFPPVVQFSWKRQKKGGSLEDLTSAQGDQLELRESGHRASIRLVDRDDLYTYKYICSVKHEGGIVNANIEERVEDRVEAQALQGVPAPAASCPPEREPADLAALQQHHLSFQSQCRVKLLCLLYTVLIVKSLVYCCGLSLLTSLTNKGPSTSSTHAD
ncbi:immunoglobulin lambda-1 light chain-like [Mugil cephalus]|uniref:immunoglobulin lambda-1 light chain-like n=1 Tax=Mugil cephalus TaxID=48193 RepID=UPI001FB70F0E|nr:immunoglobulin lambda-1 light chain-like [Mugil cephalus]